MNDHTACDLTAFLENPAFVGLLTESWHPSGYYLDASTELPASGGLAQYLVSYHTYLGLLGSATPWHRDRAEKLVRSLASSVRADGLIVEPDGSVTDHPAHACHVVDGLGTFAFYGSRLGWDGDAIREAIDAIVRVLDFHPVVRQPGGIVGRTQQLRFELRAYYWGWRVTGHDDYQSACRQLWGNGLHAYRNAIADHGALLQPSLHPDWTWNYTCSSGTTTEYATNTHTPVYYATEPQGFGFVYAHGLKDGVWDENPEWSAFCRSYFQGLLRNISRAGHTASDLDGYGVHRAWYAGCLVETAPVEAAFLSDRVGCPELTGWFRWYVDRYVDFLRRSPAFPQTGLTEQCPYGHHITIEKQFPPLLGARFYSHLARAMYEYRLDQIAPVQPPAFGSYAWWHDWLRISTPVYETSFVGTTSLRNIPKVRHFGDPNLGCIHGGALLSTLFARNELLYATSNEPDGLWHVELRDFNDNTFRSSGTSFCDHTSMTVQTSDGQLLSRDTQGGYVPPLNLEIGEQPVEVLWAKDLTEQAIRFFAHSAYGAREFAVQAGASFPEGLMIRSAAYLLAIPQPLSPEILQNGEWVAMEEELQNNAWPEAVRWGSARARVTVKLAADSAMATGGYRVQAVPVREWGPGGENSFCPFPVWQLRLEAAVTPVMGRVALALKFQCEQMGPDVS